MQRLRSSRNPSISVTSSRPGRSLGRHQHRTHRRGVRRSCPAGTRAYAGATRNNRLAAIHAAMDRELHIRRSWTCDSDRCRAAGLGGDAVFATKPELAAHMIGRFLDTGHRVSWVRGVYGGNPKLRSALEQRQLVG